MNFKILIILFLISCVYSASISGFIRDADTGEPLSYANIIILDSNIGVASNNNGYYIIPDISQGQYILKVMVIGYVVMIWIIGFFAASIIFLLIFCLTAKYKNPYMVIIAGVATNVVVLALFEYGLSVQLPRGLLLDSF